MIRDSTSRPAAWLRWALSRVGHYLEPLIAVRVVSRGRGYHLGLRRCIRKRRKFYRGSQWVALDRPSLEHLLYQFTENRQLNRVFRRSIIPDESYVQTIMTPQYPPASGPLNYVEWVVEEDAPRTLTMQDLPKVLAQGSPFCRKVEIGVSDELMDELDRRSAISA
ncbi:beta-1,6-N-acetylglucosaminyltransferase [Ornithinimicrobium sp. CNJ-824]|uniref:beta-1,6-N-acetylglucosaminyltransferase n=1 Tax=Ornithinimicrobium sp. CNJ-824 TaxID=1904966 RepID=UPI0009F9B255